MKEREDRLLDAVLNGSEVAFEELVTGEKDRLYRIVMRIVRNRDDALEVIQDSLMKAYRGIPSFQRESSFSTWLISIAVREAINRVKRDRFRGAISLHFLGSRPSPSKYSPDQYAESSMVEQKVSEAIGALPAVQKAVFTMKFYEGLKIREIAELLGSSEGAVKANYFHAVRKLRTSLAELREKE